MGKSVNEALGKSYDVSANFFGTTSSVGQFAESGGITKKQIARDYLLSRGRVQALGFRD